MDRTVTRKYALSPQEVRDAILDRLGQQDVPTPRDYDDVEFSMSDQGVTIKWTDTI